MDPKVRVSTLVRSHDDPDKVKDSVRFIFPDWEPDYYPEKSPFPVARKSEMISAEIPSIDGLLSILRENRVLDTALDAMAMKAHEDGTVFHLSRQSASIGKVSFVLDGNTLGGLIEVSLHGTDIEIWLEQQTWHVGRESVPREVGDEFSMDPSGDASEWFQTS
tara:strand:- start:997 stop:1485 length:489 start_codon:yes stop_codon:yes gene_type:complete